MCSTADVAHESSHIDDRVLGEVLRIATPPLCPELRLWLVGPHIDLNARCEALMHDRAPPYWAFCWGSGQALARHILDRPQLVAGKRVVDLGTGCGVVALAAARAGAHSVVAVDTDRRALQAVERNARSSSVRVDTSHSVPEAWDVLLASDVLYELGIKEWLLSCVSTGRGVVVSDPLRPGTPRLPWEPARLFEEVRTVPDVDYPMHRAAIYEWVPPTS